MKRSTTILFAIVLAAAVGLLYFSKVKNPKSNEAIGNGSSPNHPTRSITDGPYRPTWSPSSAPPTAVAAAQGAKKAESPAFAMVAPGNQALAACEHDSRCPKGTICFPVDKDHVGCFGSNCRGIEHSTEDCGAGRTCILIDAPKNIHRCANAGSAQLGEECNTVRPTFKEKTCEAGLECIAGKCRESCSSRTCRLGAKCVQLNDTDKLCIDDACFSD